MNALEEKYHGILRTIKSVVADPACVCLSNAPFEGYIEVAVLCEDRLPRRINFYDRHDRWLDISDKNRWIADCPSLCYVGPSLEDVLAQVVLEGLVTPTERPS